MGLRSQLSIPHLIHKIAVYKDAFMSVEKPSSALSSPKSHTAVEVSIIYSAMWRAKASCWMHLAVSNNPTCYTRCTWSWPTGNCIGSAAWNLQLDHSTCSGCNGHNQMIMPFRRRIHDIAAGIRRHPHAWLFNYLTWSDCVCSESFATIRGGHVCGFDLGLELKNELISNR